MFLILFFVIPSFLSFLKVREKELVLGFFLHFLVVNIEFKFININ
jgi:hypothetical protein